MKKIINTFPKKYKWTIHNLIAHPLSEICFLLGQESLSQKIHDSTVPDDDKDLQENIDRIMNPERDD